MHQRILKAILLIPLLLVPVIASALADDKTKTAQLQADYADLNQSRHHGEFIGHVTLTQGTTKIQAHRLAIDGTTDDRLQHAVAYGDLNTQAHYLTRTALDKPLLHAYADAIHYYPAQSRIDLLGKARVVQGKDVLSADKIRYDTEKQRVISRSVGKERVTILINPEK